MAKRSAPEVNAGSMADIAFLLLIFFLVTTTIEKDSGINRKLPPMEEIEPPIIKQKNIFTVLLNGKDQLLVEDELMEIADLRAAAVEFLDNNGDKTCDYCQGKKDPSSSDNPDKAIISLKNERETSYARNRVNNNIHGNSMLNINHLIWFTLFTSIFSKCDFDHWSPVGANNF